MKVIIEKTTQVLKGPGLMTSDGEWFRRGVQFGKADALEVIRQYHFHIVSEEEVKEGDAGVVFAEGRYIAGKVFKDLAHQTWDLITPGSGIFPFKDRKPIEKIVATTNKSVSDNIMEEDLVESLFLLLVGGGSLADADVEAMLKSSGELRLKSTKEVQVLWSETWLKPNIVDINEILTETIADFVDHEKETIINIETKTDANGLSRFWIYTLAK